MYKVKLHLVSAYNYIQHSAQLISSNFHRPLAFENFSLTHTWVEHKRVVKGTIIKFEKVCSFKVKIVFPRLLNSGSKVRNYCLNCIIFKIVWLTELYVAIMKSLCTFLNSILFNYYNIIITYKWNNIFKIYTVQNY